MLTKRRRKQHSSAHCGFLAGCHFHDHRLASEANQCFAQCVRACVRARASVHACVRVRVRVCFAGPSAKHLRACVWAWLRAHMCGTRVSGTPRRLCGRCGGTVLAARARLRFGVSGVRCRARSAAGVTWTCRTAKAGWAARSGHTSVVDANSGAIYVLGGTYGDGTTGYNDVWATTDGGARAGGRGVGRRGTPGGYPKGY